MIIYVAWGNIIEFWSYWNFICWVSLYAAYIESICCVIIYAFEYIYIEVICAACGDNRSRGPPAICEAEVILRFSKILRNSIPFLQYWIANIERLALWFGKNLHWRLHGEPGSLRNVELCTCVNGCKSLNTEECVEVYCLWKSSRAGCYCRFCRSNSMCCT